MIACLTVADGAIWRPRPRRIPQKISGQVFYAVECIPDSESKRIYIKSAYIKKDSNGQELNVEEKTPQLTSETPLDGIAINAIVNEENQNVKENKG